MQERFDKLSMNGDFLFFPCSFPFVVSRVEGRTGFFSVA
jgi:hypothetical protein